MAGNLQFLPDTGFWRGKRVLVTGGNGFLGRHICERLSRLGAEVITPRKAEFNFTSMDLTMRCLSTYRPEMVFHSAAYYGGLGITLNEPGRIYYENLVMGANLMEASRLNDVQKFITVGTSCSYPGNISRKMTEEDLWAGPLHDSVLAYGSVKKMMAIQGIAYKKQFGFNSIHLIPTNLYGPWDAFDHYRSHVVGALVRKFHDATANNENVTLWGTGEAVRELLFVEDCADGIVLAAEKYHDVSPLNLGTGVGTSIRDLANIVAKAFQFRGQIQWDRTKPDGQATKVMDTTKMTASLNWAPRTTLELGVTKTIEWYKSNQGGSIEPARKAA